MNKLDFSSNSGLQRVLSERPSVADIDEDIGRQEQGLTGPTNEHPNVTTVDEWPKSAGQIPDPHTAMGVSARLIAKIILSRQSLEIGATQPKDLMKDLASLAVVHNSLQAHPKVEPEDRSRLLNKEKTILTSLLTHLQPDEQTVVKNRISEIENQLQSNIQDQSIRDELRSSISSLNEIVEQMGAILQPDLSNKDLFATSKEEAENRFNSATTSETEKLGLAFHLQTIANDDLRNEANQHLEELQRPGLSEQEIKSRISQANTAIESKLAAVTASKVRLLRALMPVLNHSVQQFQTVNAQATPVQIAASLQELSSQLELLFQCLSVASPEQKSEIKKQIKLIQNKVKQIKEEAQRSRKAPASKSTGDSQNKPKN